mgnify:FL=1
MYDSGPSEEELSLLGLLREDVVDDRDFEVWPENWEPYLVFARVSTQWRTGPGGPVGLDYKTVEWVMGLLRVKNPLRVLDAIQVLEFSALRTMNKS